MTHSSKHSSTCNRLARGFCALLLAAAVGVTAARAAERVDLSHAVTAAFKGDIIVIQSLPEAAPSDKEMIAVLKARRLKELQGEPKGDVIRWSLRVLVFPAKTVPGPLKLEFYDLGKNFVADHRLEDVPASAACFQLDLDIDEDEGLAKGKTYSLKLVTEHDAVIAQTTLLMK